MAFFDDLGKKISQAGQAVSQKSKDFSDVSKLNTAIANEEKKLQANYYHLGRIYITKHGNDYEPVFAETIKAIKESEQNIINYRMQIQDIKGIIRCEKCGAEIPNNVLFCSTCGTPVPPKETVPNTVRCLSCGKINSKDVSFCTNCGTPLSAAPITEPTYAPTPAPSYRPNPTPAPAPVYTPAPQPVAEAKKCTTCGADVPAGMAFCQECGTRLI